MTFQECYELIRQKFLAKDMSMVSNNFSVLLYLYNDTERGYVHAAYLGGKKYIEPVRHSYYDLMITTTTSVFEELAAGRLDPLKAFTAGYVQTKGNIMAAMMLYNMLH